MRRERRISALVVTGVFGVAGLVTWAAFGGSSGIQYRTAAVGHGDINVTISAKGNPNAVVTVQVGSQVSGNILALFADFNTRVTKGQLIAQIDPASRPRGPRSPTAMPSSSRRWRTFRRRGQRLPRPRPMS